MQALRQHYFPDGGAGPRNSPRQDKLPVYVMFVTDGQTTDQDGHRDQIEWSSYEPIFWQFMAIGQSSKNVVPDGAAAAAEEAAASAPGFAAMLTGDFQFLEELDDMPGRFLDNADFFSVADPAAAADDQLYDLMMTEYPGWLQQARQRGLDLRLTAGGCRSSASQRRRHDLDRPRDLVVGEVGAGGEPQPARALGHRRRSEAADLDAVARAGLGRGDGPLGVAEDHRDDGRRRAAGAAELGREPGGDRAHPRPARCGSACSSRSAASALPTRRPAPGRCRR